ncbi:alpha/beta fold hydrolase [Microbacterium ureisolvens]|uniref:Alpha/beta fold hydrolase n=1 Tax=Microbacterium ureisolvens TaxID=2781186 RepID=A0ABS7HZ51_9MICO|nr:alpha/beta fold hydrolase [Microbacterium ureisolvens]MBW9110679.1 alpha/beta fold hydrolase [Microbacterium ureisolvens]
MIDRIVPLANGLKPRVIDTDAGEPLLMLHGAESDRTQYVDLIRRLPPGVRAISYDQRDLEPATAAPEGVDLAYEMGDLADDAAHLLDALGLDAVHVVGTSFGGALAQHLALRHPHRVRSLILVATTASPEPVLDYIERSRAVPAGERERWALSGALSDSAAAESEIVAAVRATIVARTPEQRARRMGALSAHDTLPALSKIHVPTTVIHGTDDPVIPYSAGVEIAEAIPGAALVPVPGARHALAFEYPDPVLGVIAAHLR